MINISAFVDSSAAAWLVLMIPLLAVTYSYFTNLIIAYLSVRFVAKKQIKDKTNFLKFILENTPLIFMFEIVLLFLTFQIDNYLISATIYSVLSGIAIFLVFNHFVPKKSKVGKRQKNAPLFTKMLSNTLMILSILYILPFILKIL